MEKKRKCKVCRKEVGKGKRFCDECAKVRKRRASRKYLKKKNKEERKEKEKLGKFCRMCGVSIPPLKKETFCNKCIPKRERIANWRQRGLVPSLEEYDNDTDWNWIFDQEEQKNCPCCEKKAKLSLHSDLKTGLIYGYACEKCKAALRSADNDMDYLCAMIAFLAPNTARGIFTCSENYYERNIQQDI